MRKQLRMYAPLLLLITTILLCVAIIAYTFARSNLIERITHNQQMLILDTITDLNEEIKRSTSIAQFIAALPFSTELIQISIASDLKNVPIQNTPEYTSAQKQLDNFFLYFSGIVALEVKNIQGTTIAEFKNPSHNHIHTAKSPTSIPGKNVFATAVCETDNRTIAYLSMLLYQKGTNEVIGLIRVLMNIYEKPNPLAQITNTGIYVVNTNFKPIFTPTEYQQQASHIDFSTIIQHPLGEFIYLDSTPKQVMIAQHMPTTDWFIVNITSDSSLFYPLYKLNILTILSVSSSLFLLLLMSTLALHLFYRKMQLLKDTKEEQLRTQERRLLLIEHQNSLLNVLFETLPFAVAICTDTKILYTNAICRNLLGLREGNNIKDAFVNPTDHDVFMSICSNKGIVSNIQTQIYDQSRRKRHLLLTATPLVFEECNAFIYWFNEITALCALELTLKENYRLLRTLLNTIPQSVFYKDLKGEYVFCNHAFTVFTGLPEGFILGKTDSDLIHYAPHIASLRQEDDKSVLKNEKPLIVEACVPLEENTKRFFETIKIAHKDFHNQTQGIVGISHEITKHKLLEEELLQNKHLAEIANKTKSSFLTGISHEIRVAMNGILGLNYLALQDELNPKIHNYLTKIESTSWNMLALINNILNVSSIEAGKVELKIAPFRLQEILCSIKDMVEPPAQKKNITFQINIDPRVPSLLLGDSLLFSQILIKLLANAVQATHKGSITLNISTISSSEHHIMLACRVIDTGVGMPESQLAQLLSEDHKNLYPTTNHAGLGLSIVQGLISLMQGKLTASSILGHGSTFRFTAQFEQVQQSTPFTSTITNTSTNSTAMTALPLKDIHVLVAEDNEFNQLIVKEHLERFGCKVSLASNGVEALAVVTKIPIDIILMDIQMPLMDGLSTTETLRKSQEYAHIPIIAMTTHVLESDREHSLQVGRQDHIIKPIDPEHLLNTLLHVLKRA